MFLVVGLGNPGIQYSFTRHNIGFMIADTIVCCHDFRKWRKKFHGEISDGILNNTKIIILKPHTFMNMSGDSVHKAIEFYNISIQNVIVLHDDLNLRSGKLSIKYGGSHGGHNGLRSINDYCGSQYKRLRIGIGRPNNKQNINHYVLSCFSNFENNSWVIQLINSIAKQLSYLIHSQDQDFIQNILTNIKNY